MDDFGREELIGFTFGFVKYKILLTIFFSYVFAAFQKAIPDTSGKRNESYAKAIPTFLTLYIFGLVYQLVLVWDALRLKNTIQVIGLCLFNGALLIYASVQKDQIRTSIFNITGSRDDTQGVWKSTRPFLIAVPCVLALGSILMCAIAWKLYDEFSWTIYKHISADLRMKRRYLTFQVPMPISVIGSIFCSQCPLDLHHSP